LPAVLPAWLARHEARLEAVAEFHGLVEDDTIFVDIVERRGDRAPPLLGLFPCALMRANGVAVVFDPFHNPLALSASLLLPEKPSIAVLPFQNISDDPEQEYFADGIVEDITTAFTCIMDNNEEGQLLVGTAAIARFLGVTKRMAQHRIADGELLVLRIGRRVCARRTTLLAGWRMALMCTC
jgi:hypothetical protein